MNIAIYGAGSLGTVIGAFLAKAGYTVDLVTRNRGHLQGLRQKGAHITGMVDMTVPVHALAPDEMSGCYDFIFLLTKQGDNAAVVPELQQHLTGNGAVCTFQNGLPERLIGSIIGHERTFGCTVAWGATLHGDGMSELTSDPHHLTFDIGQGNAGKDTARLEQLRDILQTIGPVTIVDNFTGARWSKLLINSSFSVMSAILGCTLGEAARRTPSRRIIQRLMKECIDVTKAAGVTITPVQGKDIARLFDYHSGFKRIVGFMLIPLAIKKHRLLTASMLHDLTNNKLTEVEFINGSVRDCGREYGVPTPTHERAIAIIHRIESGELRPEFGNVKLF